MDALKMLREDMGISQQFLADNIGTTQQSIHRYENGLYEPDITTLKALADFFGTSIDYIVGHTDIRHKIEPVEEYALNESERALVDRYRGLLPNQGRTLDLFLDSLEGKQP